MSFPTIPRRLSLASLLLLLTASPASALAEDAAVSVDAPREPPPQREAKDWTTRRELALSIRHGIFIDGHSGGIAVGAEVIHRRGLLVVGLVGDYGTTVITAYTYWGGGAALGVSAPVPSWLRLDLLGVAGAHSYSHVGALAFPGSMAAFGYFSDEGSRAVLPFAGARLRSSVEVGASKRFAIGLEALGETDLARVARSYETTSLSLGYRDVSTSRRTVGTERFSATLTLGGSFDL